MRPDLERYGVEIVAICTDPPEAIRNGRAKHGLRAVLLSDPELEVTDRYDLRNPTNLTPRGIHGMPVPTTILVDASGTVRWIDQAENYQVRAHPDRVLAAIREHLAAP